MRYNSPQMPLDVALRLAEKKHGVCLIQTENKYVLKNDKHRVFAYLGYDERETLKSCLVEFLTKVDDWELLGAL